MCACASSRAASPTSADSTGGPARGGWAFDDVALTAGPAGVLPLFTSTVASATCPSLTVTFADVSLNAPAARPLPAPPPTLP